MSKARSTTAKIECHNRKVNKAVMYVVAKIHPLSLPYKNFDGCT